MMGEMEENQRRRISCRKWLNDVGNWCQEKIYTLSRMALDWDEWRQRSKCGHTFTTKTTFKNNFHSFKNNFQIV